MQQGSEPGLSAREDANLLNKQRKMPPETVERGEGREEKGGSFACRLMPGSVKASWSVLVSTLFASISASVKRMGCKATALREYRAV